MITETLSDVKLQIVHVNRDGNHVIGLIPSRKYAVGLFVASANRDIIGKAVHIKRAVIKNPEMCGTKFYGPYGISNISPFEHSWIYAEADVERVALEGEVPFKTIPLSRQENLRNAVDSVTVGSRWKSKNVIWVVKDSTEEKLGGRTRTRIWIETEDGRRGQAVYADSIAMKYQFISQ